MAIKCLIANKREWKKFPKIWKYEIPAKKARKSERNRKNLMKIR